MEASSDQSRDAHRAKRAADRFYENLLQPLAMEAEVEEAARTLSAILRDPAQPIATKRHAAYYMAQVHEYRGEHSRMVEMLGFSGVRPGRDQDGYDMLAHAGWGHVCLEGQKEAVTRGIPPVYVNSIPHSGSSFLNALITQSLKIERCRTTKGMYLYSRLVPLWLWAFAQGGATTHEHFVANPENVGVLEASQIERMVIHVRHPVAVLLSAYRIFQEQPRSDRELNYFFRLLNADIEPDDIRDRDKGMSVFAGLFMPYIVRFLHSWMMYATCPATRIKLHFSKYEDLFADPVGHGRRILGHFGLAGENLDQIVPRLRKDAERGAHHFKGRDSNKHMANLDPATRAVIAPLLAPDLLKFYGYEWL